METVIKNTLLENENNFIFNKNNYLKCITKFIIEKRKRNKQKH